MRRHDGRGHRTLAGTSALLAALALGAAGCDLYFGKHPDFHHTGPVACGEEQPVFGSFPLDLGTTVQAVRPPPPISGGTLALTPDETTAVVADPDRDQVYLVEIETRSLTATIPLSVGDEPGRVVVDSAERAHVALRSGGAVATIDLDQGALLGRHEVCPAPRGLAFDEASGLIYVACHGGELMTMDPATGESATIHRLEVDLRDVVVDDTHIYVSVFRTAEVLVLDRDAQLINRMRPPPLTTTGFDFDLDREVEVVFQPTVAWRMISHPEGGVVLLHQRSRDSKIGVAPGGYMSDRCSGGVVHTAVTPLKPGETPIATAILGFSTLPVDIALYSDPDSAVIVAAGNEVGQDRGFSPVMHTSVGAPHQDFMCFFGGGDLPFSGSVIATEITQGDTVIAQAREPAVLSVLRKGSWIPDEIPLSNESRQDTGHAMFHIDSGGGISCASCHPEGSDDGRVWDFDCIGPRRTQTLQIGLLGTEPFHWDGDMDSLDTLMGQVFVGRMGGGTPSTRQIELMGSWLDTLRPPPRAAPADPDAVARGRQLFNSAEVGCQTCHAGAKLTDNRSYDVGTGGTFQVPSLIGIANRAPFIHTGCAPTLRDRFTDPDCGGGDLHGVVSHLTGAQIDDLVAYLETL